MKMKKLKNVWLFLSFILMVAGMASCSTDDDPTGVEVSKTDIIGTWEVTANSWSDSEGDSGTNDHKSPKLSLQSDGTATFQGFQYRWTLDSKKGVLTLSGSGGLTVKVTILSYTEDEIKATYSSEFSSEMYVVEGNYTFKRV